MKLHKLFRGQSHQTGVHGILPGPVTLRNADSKRQYMCNVLHEQGRGYSSSLLLLLLLPSRKRSGYGSGVPSIPTVLHLSEDEVSLMDFLSRQSITSHEWWLLKSITNSIFHQWRNSVIDLFITQDTPNVQTSMQEEEAAWVQRLYWTLSFYSAFLLYAFLSFPLIPRQ